MKTKYDSAYEKCSSYFGSDPDDVLKKYYHLIKKGGNILDIGAGQGRNTLFLANSDYNVTAIDPSEKACEILQKIAEAESPSINVFKTDFAEFSPEKDCKFSAILIFGVVQELEIEKINLLAAKVSDWLERGGLMFITAFTVDDPSFDNYAAVSESDERIVFIGDAGNVRSFFRMGGMSKLFDLYKSLHYKEFMGEMHKHGDGQAHKHGKMEGVFQKWF